MTTDRSQATPPGGGVTNRQKIMAVVFVIIFIIIIWQLWAIIRGDGGTTPAPSPTARTSPGATPAGRPGPANVPSPTAPQQMVPQPASVPKPQMPMSQHEADMMRLQQATEAKYIATLNELQMLRLERDIAETNKAIMAAKLETVTSEKNIVTLLQPPPVTQSTYARGLNTQITGQQAPAVQRVQPAQPVIQAVAPPTAAVTAPQSMEVTNYSVISVSQVQRRWSAVIGYQGNLYSVFVGDILPPDGSKVTSIDRSGVTLEKNNIKRKVSLVPII